MTEEFGDYVMHQLRKDGRTTYERVGEAPARIRISLELLVSGQCDVRLVGHEPSDVVELCGEDRYRVDGYEDRSLTLTRIDGPGVGS